jgi:phage replication-related protein YjqB (UPF0714/DUF867 family)
MSDDKYKDFNNLAANESAGVDYRIRTRTTDTTLVLAPHGGGIEPGTSELAEAIAAADHSFYIFEGLKKSRNGDLHITSSNFDEPSCLAMLAVSDVVVAIHGERSMELAVFIGGLDTERIDQIRAELSNRGFDVRAVDRTHLAGTDTTNICNRGRSGAGVQLEIAEGLRRTFFRQLSPHAERQHTTAAFIRFVVAVRQALCGPRSLGT